MYQHFLQAIFRFPHYPLEVIKKALNDNLFFDEIIKTGTFRKAIFYASPDLESEIDKYLTHTLKDIKEESRLKNTLLKYLSRMSTRCTPFGLFASCAVANINNTTNIKLSDQIEEQIRLDMLYLCNLVQKLEQEESVKNKVRYFLNTTIYYKANILRYIEYRYTLNKRSYQLSEISYNPLLKQIIKKTSQGVFITELAELLTKQYGISKFEAHKYINQLIDNQLLISEISPFVTGPDFLNYLIEKITSRKVDNFLENDLKKLNNLLKQLSQCKNLNKEIYSSIEQIIKELGINYERKYLIQSDTYRKLINDTIDNEIIEDLKDYLVFLNKFNHRYYNDQLKLFKERFYKRYEDEEIPLLEALDPDWGIGYQQEHIYDKSPLLDEIVLPIRQNVNNILLTQSVILLQRKLMEFNPEKDKEIVLSENDVSNYVAYWEDLSPTLAAMCTIYTPENEENNKYIIYCQGFFGPCAANMLGRFASSNAKIEKLVNDITEKEQLFYPDKIIAEIAHIPDLRVGNVVARPHLRDTEIIYLSNSVRKEHLFPSDLLISVRNNRIVLRSKSLNKEILPRLTTAHNYNNNPTPVYRFLCDLQYQNLHPGLLFSWGTLEQTQNYLPRVRYKNIICHPAQWITPILELKQILAQTSLEKKREAVFAWRSKKKIPQEVYLVDGDNHLYLDLNNLNSIDILLHQVKKKINFILQEVLPFKPISTGKTNKQIYNNECLIPLYKK